MRNDIDELLPRLRRLCRVIYGVPLVDAFNARAMANGELRLEELAWEDAHAGTIYSGVLRFAFEHWRGDGWIKF